MSSLVLDIRSLPIIIIIIINYISDLDFFLAFESFVPPSAVCKIIIITLARGGGA